MFDDQNQPKHPRLDIRGIILTDSPTARPSPSPPCSTTDLLDTISDWVVSCQAPDVDRLNMLKEVHAHAKCGIQGTI